MESYDILANQPVVIDNVSMMMSFIHTLTEAAVCESVLTVSFAAMWHSALSRVNRAHSHVLMTNALLRCCPKSLQTAELEPLMRCVRCSF